MGCDAALYHPNARIATVTGGATPLTADEVIAELARVADDSVYSVSSSQAEALDEHAAIVAGRMRRPVEGGGFEDAGHVWLITVLDGLVYRQAVYQQPGEAAAVYRRDGVTLGVPDAASS